MVSVVDRPGARPAWLQESGAQGAGVRSADAGPRGAATSVGDADGLLGQAGNRRLSSADHAGPLLVGLLVPDDHPDVVGAGEVLDGLDRIGGRQRVVALDGQLVGGDVAELLTGRLGGVGSGPVALT